MNKLNKLIGILGLFLALETEGKEIKRAYFAGGCFWGVEKLFKKVQGVIDTDVGYIGGDSKMTSYKEVTTGKTGHAEAIRISYDAKIVSYRELLKYFFRIHDPTTLNRQKNDRGTQYRSAIFTTDKVEIKEIEDVIEKLEKHKVFDSKIVTKVEKKMNYHLAEEYHQDYLRKNPNGYQCHLLGPKLPFK